MDQKQIPSVVLTSKNAKIAKILPAFAKGCKGRTFKNAGKAGKNLAIYGILYKQNECFEHAENFWYIDNGYFRRSKPVYKFNGYYRICKNAFYGKYLGNKPWDRFKAFKIKLHDLRKNGSKIVLVPPSKRMCKINQTCEWLGITTKKLKNVTDRPIVVSTKEKPMQWKDIWCVVCCMSNVQTEALIKGYPIITTHYTNMGNIDNIENPSFDRQLLADLAYQQWNIKQIETGQAWRELQEL